jgi:hypothetical protein
MPDLLTNLKKPQTLFEQRKLIFLLNPLLALFQAEESCIALASLMLSTYQCANNGVVRDLCETRLVGFDLVRKAVEFGPIDL